MKLLLEAISIFLLCIVAFQDFRHRSISGFLIPALFIVFLAIAIQSIGLINTLSCLSVNVAFDILQFLFLTVYFSIRKKRWINIINVYLGIGDLLFFLILGAVFSPVNFIFFYIGSLSLTGLGYGIFMFLKRNSWNEIPLAGAMAVVLICCFFYKYWNPDFDFYNDQDGILLLNSLF